MSFTLEVAGLVGRYDGMAAAAAPTPWPRVGQITRHVCIEGWKRHRPLGGRAFRRFLAPSAPTRGARYVTFRCADNYSPRSTWRRRCTRQTQLTFWFDGTVLPRDYGFPMKLRVPTKLGFKNPKHIVAIEVGNEYTGGYWETYATTVQRAVAVAGYARFAAFTAAARKACRDADVRGARFFLPPASGRRSAA